MAAVAGISRPAASPMICAARWRTRAVGRCIARLATALSTSVATPWTSCLRISGSPAGVVLRALPPDVVHRCCRCAALQARGTSLSHEP